MKNRFLRFLAMFLGRVQAFQRKVEMVVDTPVGGLTGMSAVLSALMLHK
jgi:hypothetical protein